MSPTTATNAEDVLTILGACSPSDVEVRRSRGAWSTYTFEVALSKMPDRVLPIDAPTAEALLANGASHA